MTDFLHIRKNLKHSSSSNKTVCSPWSMSVSPTCVLADVSEKWQGTNHTRENILMVDVHDGAYVNFSSMYGTFRM